MKSTKKNGTISVYDDQKVVSSILKANAETGEEEISEKVAVAMADDVFSRLTESCEIITTADVRKCVYDLLCERGFPKTARLYVEFRNA